MEMCYDGALVMPNSFALVTEDEMEYIDGGWSGGLVLQNLWGLVSNIGLNVAADSLIRYVSGNTQLNYGKMLAQAATKVAKWIWALPVWAKLLVAGGTGAALWALGTWRIF